MEDLNTSLKQYEEQLVLVNQALESASNEERESLVTLQSDLQQLIQLTQENLDSIKTSHGTEVKDASEEIDDEYALFMEEMAKSGAYEPDASDTKEESGSSKDNGHKENEDSDIEDELASLLGMKCAVYHTHKWGGQPTLHNAMVSSVVPREDADQFNDLQVRILFTHPTHAEMLPCPFFLDGECRFSDEQCRYSHGTIVPLSKLNEAIEPSFEAIKPGSRIFVKLKPPDDEDISLTKKSTEKYHLWHRAVITSIELEKRVCSVKLEHGVKSGNKRKVTAEEYNVCIEDIFPLNTENDEDSSSDGSLSDTEYPDNKSMRTECDNDHSTLIAQHLPSSGPALGEWERHTRGIGSKLMLAMGYVPGSGLGAAGEGIVAPVEARVLPVGKSLDQCMAISERNQERDPMKVQQRLKRLQKKEEERNKRAYEREKEKERKNVFNFINRTLGDTGEMPSAAPSINVRESTSKDLNIEQFKITEDVKKLEKEVIKLNISLGKYPTGTPGYRSIAAQIAEKNKEIDTLKRREQQITREQKQRKDKAKMTVF